MVSFRNFAASLLAVLIAVIIGAVLGSGVLVGSPLRLSGDSPKAIGTAGATAPAARTGEKAAAGQGEVDAFARAVGGRAVAGILTGQSVVVVTVPGADQGDVDAVKEYLGKAGAQLAGHIGVTDAFVSTANEEKLRTVVDNIIPAGAPLDPKNFDQQSRVGDLLGAVLSQQAQDKVKPEERANAVNLLRENGYLSVAQEPAPATAVVLVTGGALPADSGDQGPATARFAKALRARLGGAVLAGRSGSADGSAPVALVRADKGTQLSTIDNVGSPVGQIAAALALVEQTQGHAGQYGTGAGASAIVPAVG
ncbi:MAG: copper transporter [Segniliparus sp.]|uniref:copper transporter n=1 Tax=Segniliparus sp. TaxID=2804064 RepID=UPI003F344D31